ncbi:MAG: CPBP family intramembrane glutamic endopeptidase [Candidatus Aenigmatarchaeota archaeon]
MKSVGIKRKEIWLTLVSKRFFIFTILIYLLFVPALFFSYQIKEFQAFYPLWKLARKNFLNFIFYEICILTQIFSTEFFFRNFLIFPFRKFGIISILPQSIPYFLLHLGKPFLEFLASFLAGIFFGFLSYKSKSILPSFLLHFLIALTLDTFIIFM